MTAQLSVPLQAYASEVHPSDMMYCPSAGMVYTSAGPVPEPEVSTAPSALRSHRKTEPLYCAPFSCAVPNCSTWPAFRLAAQFAKTAPPGRLVINCVLLLNWAHWLYWIDDGGGGGLATGRGSAVSAHAGVAVTVS